MLKNDQYFIFVDPGGTTGFVVINGSMEVILSAEVASWFDVPKMVEQYFLYCQEFDYPTPVVVAESFHISAQTIKKSRQNEPIDILGALRYLNLKYTESVLVTQTPSEAKTFSTNDKLKKIGFWYKGGAGHANDAFRHALLYLTKHGHINPKDLV
jgi:hypothetical protein